MSTCIRSTGWLRRCACAALVLALSCLPGLFAAEKSSGGAWEVLFGGRTVEKWRGYRLDDFPLYGWKVEDGVLKTITKGKVVDLVTRAEYEDFELELEWKVTPGANSGIMYRVSEAFDEAWQTGPEMQVLDDDRHADGKNPLTSAGALYALMAPTGKQLKPVGEWNQVRLVVKGTTAQHWLNGVKIVEYDLASDSMRRLIAQSKFADKPRFGREAKGRIVLQHHEDEVWYRNIRIRRL